MASSRFPGKPLLKVRGLPMIEHVRRRTLLCRRFCDAVVATCDREIADVVEGYGGRCFMTSSAHLAATDRVAEAMRLLDCTHVVNVQGDEILILPSELEKMVCAMEREPAVPAWNAVTRIRQEAQLRDRSVVKCVISVSERILFCSREFSPCSVEAADSFEPIRVILGILGYRRDFLERYSTLVRTPFERAEGIDQSRILEHDVMLRGVEFPQGSPGINEPREVAAVERCLTEDPAQRAVLEEILSRGDG